MFADSIINQILAANRKHFIKLILYIHITTYKYILK